MTAGTVTGKLSASTRDSWVEGSDEAPTGGWANESFVDSYWRGVKTTHHFQDDSFIVKKEYDAQPLLKNAAEARAYDREQNHRWRENHKVGEVSQAVLAGFIARGLTDDELSDALYNWFQENPLMAWTDKIKKDKTSSGGIILL